MQLYAGMSDGFIQDNIQNRIAEKLRDSFVRHFRYHPPDSEVRSWRNSLRAISQVFQNADLTDHGVILEYQLPMTSKRLDCLVCGKDIAERENAVVVELKQWERCSPAFGENLVTTFLGLSERETLHPSVQVRQYRRYLEDTHTAFYEGDSPVSLSACAYLHNYHCDGSDYLRDQAFADLLHECPAFTADDVDPLSEFLTSKLSRGGRLSSADKD